MSGRTLPERPPWSEMSPEARIAWTTFDVQMIDLEIRRLETEKSLYQAILTMVVDDLTPSL